jgi:hypothetical protein
VGWLKHIVSEVVGLFVDDAAFAASIVIWIAIVGLAAWALPAARVWLGPTLFAGLAAILAVGVARRRGG